MIRPLPSIDRFALVLPAAALLFAAATSSPEGACASDRLARCAPSDVGLRSEHLEHIEPLVRRWLREGQMAGCVVAIGRHGKLAYLRAFGDRVVKPQCEPMTVDTLFDMASLTKPTATATSIMILIDRGQIRLHDRVSRYLPEFRGHGKDAITVLDLLTHQGGLIPDNPISDYQDGPAKAFERVMELELQSKPGERFKYTDVGFIVLGWLVERITGKNVDQFARENIFRPLGMTDTGYLPDAELRRRAAATEQRDGKWLRGEVHDPRAHLLGGVAGHAGLFSTVDDMAIYAQMMLQHGRFAGHRILSPAAVEAMTRGYRVSSGLRGLGWDKQTGYSSNRGEWMTRRAFGHGGFTGTAMWIDPGYDLFVIFLSTRLHPDGKGSVNRLAGRIGTIAVAAVEPGSTEHDGTKRACCASGPSPVGRVLCGVDRLSSPLGSVLRGKRVGLITNHTGIDRKGVTTIRRLHDAPGIDLRVLFSPEHGLHGKLDIPRIDDSKEEGTGLRVFSLYGKTRKPTPDMLKDIDVLVFDIQDIGTRFYTYISTMGLAMEAALEAGKEFVVLDRPNPIGGVAVEGPVLDAGQESFVGFHSLPVRHGMTAGELARMFQAERHWDKLRLTVIPMVGWRRSMYWDETGCRWVDPSPNMRTPHEALLYPGIGMLETTNLSVGCGTDTPFEVVGAPWLDGERLAEALRKQHHPGLGFVPLRFTPDASKYEGTPCGGIRIVVTCRDVVEPVPLGLSIADWLRRNHSREWDTGSLRLVGDTFMVDAIRNAGPLEKMIEHARREAAEFTKRRRPFLLYR